MSKRKPDLRSITIALQLTAEKKWNDTEFADYMGVSPQVVYNWTQRGMPADRLERASQVLGHSIDYLLGRAGKAAANVVSISQPWPFSVNRKRYDDLSPEEKIRLDERVKNAVEEFEANRGKRKQRG